MSPAPRPDRGSETRWPDRPRGDARGPFDQELARPAPAWYEVPQASSSTRRSPRGSSSKPLQIGVAGLEQQAPAQGVGDGPRLLVDLLEHEVRVAALLGLRGVPVDGARLPLARLPLDVGDHRLAGGDRHHVPFVEEDHLAGVLEDGGHVGCQEGLPLAEPHAPAARHSWRRRARPGACRRRPPARRRRAPAQRPPQAFTSVGAPRQQRLVNQVGRRSRCRSPKQICARPPPARARSAGSSR